MNTDQEHHHTVGLRPDGRQERELRALQTEAAGLERVVYARLSSGRDVSPREAAAEFAHLPRGLLVWTLDNARRRFVRQLAADLPLDPDPEPPVAGDDLIAPVPGGVIIAGVSGVVPVDLSRLPRWCHAVWRRQAGGVNPDPALDVDGKVLSDTYIEFDWWAGAPGWVIDVTLWCDVDADFSSLLARVARHEADLDGPLNDEELAVLHLVEPRECDVG